MLLMPVAQRYNSFAAAQRLDLSLGNLHFGVAAWLCRVHRGSNAAEMQTHYRPLRVRKHQNGNLAASQVLLILDILVCREQYLEAGRLRGIQQITVRELVPAALSRLNNSVPTSAGAMPLGVPWSKRTSIVGRGRRDLNRWRIQAASTQSEVLVSFLFS